MIKTAGQMLVEHEKFVATAPRYVVTCSECGQDWEPLVHSPLWWRAKKKSDKGFLDALHVSGYDCECRKRPYRPDAPFRVTGYDDMCSDYDIPFDTFFTAVTAYIARKRMGDVVFITGVSRAVEEKLRHMI